MRKNFKFIVLIIMLILTLSTTGCASYDFAEEGTIIITAEEVINISSQENVVIVDAQTKDEYSNGHILGSVNISRADIVVNTPFSNMLAPKKQIENVMGKNGISNDKTVIVYDNTNNMDASRLWWTLLVYGFEDVKIVSGGKEALINAGAEITTDIPEIKQTSFIAKEANSNYIATKADVEAIVNVPDENIVLIDTRSIEEFNQGTIPGSLNIDYNNNNYADKTFKSPEDIQIMYIEKGLVPEKTAVMYCKTSIRGAQTFAALWNSGYRKLKLYDGAWVEWSADESMPSDTPSDNQAPVQPNNQDNS